MPPMAGTGTGHRDEHNGPQLACDRGGAAMKKLPHRLAEGGRIARDRPLSFTLEGRTYSGYAGDTLASALLANGLTLIERSFKYHRPRGFLAAGCEEPNGLVTLGEAGRTTPNVAATVTELHDGLCARRQNG